MKVSAISRTISMVVVQADRAFGGFRYERAAIRSVLAGKRDTGRGSVPAVGGAK